MQYKYIPQGVCSMEMIFDIENNIIKSLEIVGGCPGNTVGVARLVAGKSVEGIPCGFKGTSCPDQVAEALEEYKENH